MRYLAVKLTDCSKTCTKRPLQTAEVEKFKAKCANLCNENVQNCANCAKLCKMCKLMYGLQFKY